MGQGRWPSKQEVLTANPQGPQSMATGACDSGIVGWRQLDAGSSLPNKPGPNDKNLVQEEKLSQGNQDPCREKHLKSTSAHLYVCYTPLSTHQSVM